MGRCIALHLFFSVTGFCMVLHIKFTPLVHEYLGGKRIPLPACSYYAIRKTFPHTSAYARFETEDTEWLAAPKHYCFQFLEPNGQCLTRFNRMMHEWAILIAYNTIILVLSQNKMVKKLFNPLDIIQTCFSCNWFFGHVVTFVSFHRLLACRAVAEFSLRGLQLLLDQSLCN